MTAASVRTHTATAAVAAITVVLGHLAWAWSRHAEPLERQAIAFDHGVAAAAVVALVLAGSRLALALDGEIDAPLADAVAVAGTVAALGHMASVWRDHGLWETLPTVAGHAAAIALVFVAREAVARAERPRWRAHRAPIAAG